MTQSETLSLDSIEAITDEAEKVATDSPPKRGRGRPRGSTNKPKSLFGAGTGTKSSNPAPNGARGVRRGSKIWIREQWIGLVGLGNLGLLFIAKDDALDETEMTMLSDALTAETMNSDRIMNWMSRASSLTPHVLMIQACIAIAIPRLRRRGILPAATPLTDEQKAAYDEYIRTAQTATESDGASDNPGAPVPMEARPASQFDGGYGQR